VDLRLETIFLVLVVVYEPFGKTGATSAILKENETDLIWERNTIFNKAKFKYMRYFKQF